MKQRACLFIFIVIFTACQSPVPVAMPSTLPATQVIPGSSTPSPVPTVYLSSTPSPTPTVETLIFPYTIEGLRKHNFRSGEIRILSTLSENDKFRAYLIEYPSDELTITGVMQIPVGEGPYPVILLNHGFYPRGIYSSGDGTDRAAAFLAQHGYMTIASDYRSWGESDIGHSFFYSGLVIDVINLLNAIPSIPEADPDRIGMWGHSMGGGVTIKVVTIDPRVRAAVLYSPVSADHADIIGRWGNGCFGDLAQGEVAPGCNSADVVPEDLPQNLQDAYRFAGADPMTLQLISPFYHLEHVNVPVQIHYGTEDGNFLSGTPPQWSVKLTQGLRDAGKQAELYEYEGEGHSFIGQPWFDFMGRVLRFFDTYVK